ncbi:ABC transporter permease [Streptomyces sp. RS10V-4]|uniref:ABC transporter permease n=1 Tax=Streptomyces rhizoryzae TaxID=2932493 RepID=UPI002004E084|nr:ABC transporter permease subunit [Streptomyces rhizoryzae]MCK7623660.1 ABC transporter permease [Streptomyces rhizoryzae]
MSRAEAGPTAAAAAAAGPAVAGGPRWPAGLVRSEIALTFRRWRTRVLLAVLAAVPVLVGIAVRIQSGRAGGGADGRGPAFLAQIAGNGLFLVFTALAVTLPVFLPMAVGVIAGDAVAGEAHTGTLRYLLVAPAGRTRLLVAKFAAVAVFCLAGTLAVALSALATGAVLFPLGRITLLDGSTLPLGAGLLRALAVAAVVALSLLGVAALGLFVSTLTDSGIAAMATTVGLVITAQILDGIPQLQALGPYLFPHHWLSFADLLRQPVYWDGMAQNLGLQAVYAAVCGSAAWARFTTRDITA